MMTLEVSHKGNAVLSFVLQVNDPGLNISCGYLRTLYTLGTHGAVVWILQTYLYKGLVPRMLLWGDNERSGA
jgi:hypothetical protein